MPPDHIAYLTGLSPSSFKNSTLANGRSFISFILDVCKAFEERYSNKQLSEIVNEFTGKWPHTRSRMTLVFGASQIIEMYHYEPCCGKLPSDRIYKNYNEACQKLKLGEKKSKKTMKDIGDKVAKRLRGMEFSEIEKWALELGAKEEDLVKYKDLTPSLARMLISNKIRGLLRKKKKS